MKLEGGVMSNEVRWFWPVASDNTVDDPYVGDLADLDGFEEGDLDCGKYIEKWTPNASIRATQSTNDGEPDDVLQTCLSVPVYSRRLRSAIEEAGIAGIQYLPVMVFRPDGTRIGGYSIANLLNVVPALDLDKSDYDVYPDDYFLPQRRGQISGIRKAVLRRSALKDLDVIRLAEFVVDIYVSDRFKTIFERGKFAGYSFRGSGEFWGPSMVP